MIRVLLVDDQPLVCAGLRRILEPQDGITVVGECEDGDLVLDAVERLQPDIVIMDVRIRRIDGAQATRMLRERGDTPPVLILTTFDDDETVAASLSAGAAGFILKDAPGEDIVRATRVVAEGGAWLDPQIAGHVLDAYRRRGGQTPGSHEAIEQLTPREREVLAHVARGATNSEIAASLHVSEATVKTHLNNILSKLQLRDRAAAIVFAHTNGVV